MEKKENSPHLMRKTINKFMTLALCTVAILLGSCSNDPIFEIIQDQELYSMERASIRRMDVGGTITVVGHKSQDPDAVCASISMAALMRELGIDAVPYMQEKPIQGVKYILDTFGYQYPQIRTSIQPGQPMVLVDHNDPMQSLDGMMDANVVGIVDHHPISQAFSSKLPIYCNCMNVGAGCTIVYNIFKKCGIIPSQEIARIMVAGIIADTDSLSKATCTTTDSLALTSLVKIAGIEDMQAFTAGLKLAQKSFDGLTDEEIFLSDIKSYIIGGVKLAITSLDANQKMHIDELCHRMHAVMPTVASQLGVQMLFAKMEESLKDENGNYILDAEGNVQYTTHFAYYGEGAKDVAEAAYGKSCTDHPDCIVTSRKLSRKTDIVPDLTRILEGK